MNEKFSFKTADVNQIYDQYYSTYVLDHILLILKLKFILFYIVYLQNSDKHLS